MQVADSETSPFLILPNRSDTGRESFTDKAERNIKPVNEQTLGDEAKGAYESATSTLKPQSQKSTTQKAGDALGGHSAQTDKNLVDKVKDKVGMGHKET
ncbi:hypothetical protein P7C70_g8935, partial [Phenoliferia sp. Uapishka_3]